MAKINILNDLLKDKELNKSRIADRLIKADETPERKLRPNFPRVIQVETTNICIMVAYFVHILKWKDLRDI